MMKKFDTVPAVNSSTGSSSEGFEWNQGLLVPNSGDLWIHYGNSQTWTRDTSWGVTQLSQKKLHQSESFRIGGENGKDHEQNYVQSANSDARWPLMKFIDGFAINYKQDSTAGHGLWLRNVGIEVVNDDGDTWRWGSNNRARQNDFTTHTAKYTFNEADKASLSNNNGRFKQFICRVSSRGGAGTRNTNLTLGDFRLLYSGTGCETGRWIIPGKRGYSQRTSQDIVVI